MMIENVRKIDMGILRFIKIIKKRRTIKIRLKETVSHQKDETREQARRNLENNYSYL